MLWYIVDAAYSSTIDRPKMLKLTIFRASPACSACAINTAEPTTANASPSKWVTLLNRSPWYMTTSPVWCDVDDDTLLGGPPRHGCVLRLRGAAALPRVAGAAGGDWRWPASSTRHARRRHAQLLGAARLRRPRRGHHRHLRGACTGRAFRHGHDEGGGAGAAGRVAAGRFRTVQTVFAPFQGRRGRDRSGHRRPGH